MKIPKQLTGPRHDWAEWRRKRDEAIAKGGRSNVGARKLAERAKKAAEAANQQKAQK